MLWETHSSEISDDCLTFPGLIYLNNMQVLEQTQVILKI